MGMAGDETDRARDREVRDEVARLVDEVDWAGVADALDRDGCALTSPLVTPAVAAELRKGFDEPGLFRSTVHMARFRYGEGTYRYYRRPLSPAVAELRERTYPPLAAIANRWGRRLRAATDWPDELDALTERCAQVGQTEPTPLILRYGPGGWNALHQDLYGDVAFPLQVAVALTEPGADFSGGENLFVEQRPRAQSRGVAVQVPLGCGLVFPNRHRPVAGAHGDHRVTVRHGVSEVRSGERVTLGVIFHDARP
jgi:hypothetical protein